MGNTRTFLLFAGRDIIIVALTFMAWQWFAAVSSTPGPLGDFTGLALGAALALCAHLMHEWGHVLGGLAGGSQMQPARRWSALSLFVFSSSANSKRQFMLMSFAGFAATALVFWFCFTLLPVDYLASRIVRGFAVLQVILAIVLEVPLVIWALVGKKLPPIDRPASQLFAGAA